MTAAVLVSPRACPTCSGAVDVKSPHVAIDGTAVKVYCSEPCLRTRGAAAPQREVLVPPRRRIGWWILGGLFAGTTGLGGWYELAYADDEPDAREQIVAFVEAAKPPAPAAAPMETKIAPGPSPEELEDKALVAELAQDAWIHPLAGPTRRMPALADGAFGASRPGDRPPECFAGHCGVDIGDTWGEPVHAVHDGEVYWVNRGPNDEHGGIFVEISHRGGTLHSWYFHLAAVPRWVQPGVKIKRGQVIGLLGDTGVGHSGPHLHFSLSVKSSKASQHERYVDPEPLIAIWPLWLPNDKVTTTVEVGVPVRQVVHRPQPAPAPANDNEPTGSATN